MDSKRNSLFPTDPPSLLSASSHDIDSRSKLFGIDGLNQPYSAPITPPSHTTSLASNLYQMSHSRLHRLVQLKYSNDPILLIKQLSLDLAQKESELFLYRQETFIREQKLYKLCNEYGNLSTLEIDQLLLKSGKNNAKNPSSSHSEHLEMKIDNMKSRHSRDLQGGIALPIGRSALVGGSIAKWGAVDSAVGDISTVAKDSMAARDSAVAKDDIAADSTVEKDKKQAKEVASVDASDSSSIGAKYRAKDKATKAKDSKLDAKLEAKDANLETKETKPELDKPKLRSSTFSQLIIPTWVKNIGRFNSDDELHKSSHVTNKPPQRPHAKSYPLKWMNDNSENNTQKVPVELEPITASSTPIPENQVNSSDVDIDKYGFFIDVNSPNKLKPPSTSDNKSSGSLQAILINDRRSYLQSIDHLIEISKIHDVTTQNYERQWQVLMKDVNRNYYKSNRSSIISFKKWTEENSDIADDSSEKFGVRGLNLLKYDSDYYYRLVHLISQIGIPENYRCELWLQLSGANNLRVNGEYLQLVKDIQNYMENDNPVIQENIRQINLDLSRTLRSNYYFNNIPQIKSGPNFFKLERILYAFVAYKPEIGYYQGMNKIVGNLLILLSYQNSNSSNNFFTEADIFWIFIGLIEEILPRYDTKSFFNGLLQIRREQIITKDVYFAEQLPQLNEHFEQLGVQFELITMNWWLTLFIDLRFISLDTWFKLFDTLLIVDNFQNHDSNDWSDSINSDANDVNKSIKLICITLAIMQSLQPFLLTLDDKSTIYRFLDGNNTSKFYDEKHNEIKINLRFSELMSHYQEFIKRIDAADVINYRADYDEK